MAYLFCRCTRSVSQPPPTYYAHLAAFRGRIMLVGSDVSDTASTMTRSSAPGAMEVRAHPNTFFALHTLAAGVGLLAACTGAAGTHVCEMAAAAN